MDSGFGVRSAMRWMKHNVFNREERDRQKADQEAVAAANILRPEVKIRPPKRRRRSRRFKLYGGGVKVGSLIGVCPGGNHAWFNSAYGSVRKPYCGTKMVPA